MAAGTGLLIGLGLLGAGTQVAGAAMGASASKDAAKIQSRSADRALAVNERVYGDQRAAMQPFYSMGQGAARTLGGLFQTGAPFTRQRQQAANAAGGRTMAQMFPPQPMAVNRAAPRRVGSGRTMAAMFGGR